MEVFPRPFFRDLTFIGRSTEHRERHFGPLKRDCNFLHIAHGVVGQEALAYYHSAPIGLNIHAEPELSWEPRVQQLMACGPLAVSEPISPNNVFTPGEHFVQTNDPNQTYQICREISAQRAKYEAMRRAGTKTCWTNFPHARSAAPIRALHGPGFSAPRLRPGRPPNLLWLDHNEVSSHRFDLALAVHLRFTPTYSSWLNQVEVWFAKIERDVIARGVFKCVPDLQRKLMRYIARVRAAWHVGRQREWRRNLSAAGLDLGAGFAGEDTAAPVRKFVRADLGHQVRAPETAGPKTPAALARDQAPGPGVAATALTIGPPRPMRCPQQHTTYTVRVTQLRAQSPCELATRAISGTRP